MFPAVCPEDGKQQEGGAGHPHQVFTVPWRLHGPAHRKDGGSSAGKAFRVQRSSQQKPGMLVRHFRRCLQAITRTPDKKWVFRGMLSRGQNPGAKEE
jgi:hypothetical protein